MFSVSIILNKRITALAEKLVAFSPADSILVLSHTAMLVRVLSFT